MFEAILSGILLGSLGLVAYLNRFFTNWVKICHILGYSSKEKPDVVLARIKHLNDLASKSEHNK